MSLLPRIGGSIGALSWPGRLAVLFLGLGVVALSFRLWPQWRHNPDLSHGFFMPVLFLLLVHEGRSGTPRYLSSGTANRLGFVTLLIGGLLALFASGLYAASVDWSHTLVNVMLTLSLVLFLGAGLIVLSRDSIRLVPFNWTLCAAIGLWLLATPIPPGTYSRLTMGLQLWVSENVLRTLHLIGVAAIRHGNIIDLANTSVGVEEACSGVRSLISCVFAAVFFSASLVSRPWARAAIILLAAPLALAMNFIRSLTLTLLANRNVDISGTWHDVTGFAVLGTTALILGGLALALEQGRKKPPTVEPIVNLQPRTADQWMLVGGLMCATLLSLFFYTHTRSSALRSDEPVPDLAALLPQGAPRWQEKSTNLFAFSGTLQTEFLAQKSYARPTESGPVEIIIYAAYWRPGQAPVSQVALHSPDACWPGSGWTPIPTTSPRASLMTEGRHLADAEHRIFKAEGDPQNVWYWHIYDRKPISYRDPYSALELLKIGWRFGFRSDGDQLFVRVSSNRPWSEIASEPVLVAFFQRTQKLGL